MELPLSFWRVITKFSADSAIPAALAALYVWWDYRTASSRTASELVKNFGVAYFFLMWFVGQYFRIAKQLADRTVLESINTTVQLIHEKLEEAAARATPVLRGTPKQRVDLIPDPTARTLFREAISSLRAGNRGAALLAAATAFEHSLRAAAKKQGLLDPGSPTAGRLLNSMRDRLPTGLVDDLMALVRIRNAIIHRQGEGLVDPDTLVESFITGAQLVWTHLGQLGSRET